MLLCICTARHGVADVGWLAVGCSKDVFWQNGWMLDGLNWCLN